MITIKQISDVIITGLVRPNNLTVNDIKFIQMFDESTIIRKIADLLNRVLDGSTSNKFKIPVIIKGIFNVVQPLISKFNIQDVNISNIILFLLTVLIDSNLIPILDSNEKVILIEIIDASLYLLNREMPVIKSKCGCLG